MSDVVFLCNFERNCQFVNNCIFTVYLGLHFRLMYLNCLLTLHGSDKQTNDIIVMHICQSYINEMGKISVIILIK